MPREYKASFPQHWIISSAASTPTKPAAPLAPQVASLPFLPTSCHEDFLEKPQACPGTSNGSVQKSRKGTSHGSSSRSSSTKRRSSPAPERLITPQDDNTSPWTPPPKTELGVDTQITASMTSSRRGKLRRMLGLEKSSVDLGTGASPLTAASYISKFSFRFPKEKQNDALLVPDTPVARPAADDNANDAAVMQFAKLNKPAQRTFSSLFEPVQQATASPVSHSARTTASSDRGDVPARFPRPIGSSESPAYYH